MSSFTQDSRLKPRFKKVSAKRALYADHWYGSRLCRVIRTRIEARRRYQAGLQGYICWRKHEILKRYDKKSGPQFVDVHDANKIRSMVAYAYGGYRKVPMRVVSILAKEFHQISDFCRAGIGARKDVKECLQCLVWRPGHFPLRSPTELAMCGLIEPRHAIKTLGFRRKIVKIS